MLKGSLTIEASLVTPLVIITGIAFLYIINILGFNMELYNQMYETADMVAKYAYSYDMIRDREAEKNDNSKITDNDGNAGFLKANIYFNMAKKTDKKIIIGGIAGVSLSDSGISDEGDIDIVAKYYAKLPFVLSNFLIFKQQTEVHNRMFTGTYYSKSDGSEDSDGKDNPDDEQYVYVTKTGKVYHTDENCTYIKPRVKEIDIKDLDKQRNDSGAKYYACEICSEGSQTRQKVYILSYGTRYHNKLDCYEIKRTVRKIKLSEAKGMRECAKCAME